MAKGESLLEKVEEVVPLQRYSAVLKKRIDAFLREHPQATHYDKLLELEKKTNIPAAAFFGGVVAVVVLLFLAIWGLNNLVDLALFCRPAFLSFEALRSSSPKTKADALLAYWALYAFIQLVEEAFSVFLPTSRILYVLPKTVFLAWAVNPVTQGAMTIYQRGLRPYLGLPAAPPSAVVEEEKQSDATKATEGYSLKVRLAAADLPQPEEDQPLNRLCVLEVVPPSSRKAVAPEKVKYKTKNDTTARFGDPNWTDDPALIKGLQSDDNFLEVTVFHKGLYSDQFLGKVRVPLKGLEMDKETEVTKPLEDPDGEAQLGDGGSIQGSLRILLEKFA